MPVFGHVQSQCTNIMSARAGRRARTRIRHPLSDGAGYPIPETVKDAARVFWTRVCRLTMGKGVGGCVRKGCMLSCLWCGWCVACTHTQTHTLTERVREREASVDFHIFADCIPQPTYSPCLSHSGGECFRLYHVRRLRAAVLMWVIVIGLLPLLTLRTNWYKFCENARRTQRQPPHSLPVPQSRPDQVALTVCRDNGPGRTCVPLGLWSSSMQAAASMVRISQRCQRT